MSTCPATESIHERLKQAQEETHVVLMIDGRPDIVEMAEIAPLEIRWEGMRNMDRYMDKGTWQTKEPGIPTKASVERSS